MENLEEEETKKHHVFSKIYENIRSEMKNRSRSRFIGSYVISWIVINWKAPMYFLFADIPIVEKLNSGFCQPTVGSWVLPLIGVAAYIVVIPFLEEALAYLNDSLLHPMQIVKLRLEHKSSMNQLERSILLEKQRNKLISEMNNESETKALIENNKYLSKQLDDLKKVVESKEVTIEELKREISERKGSAKLNASFFATTEVDRYKREPYKSVLLKGYNTKDRIIPKTEISRRHIFLMMDAKLLEYHGTNYSLTPEGILFVENYLL